MSLCNVCHKDVKKCSAKIILGEVDPPKRVGIDMRYKTNVEICPSCGIMTVVGSSMNYMRMLSEGYPPITEEELNLINVDDLLDEMILPGTHSEEIKIWVNKECFLIGELDDLSNGITFDQDNYFRLAHFMLLDYQERQKAFGKFACPVVNLQVRNMIGSLGVRDGRRRLSLLFHLGAKRIPVAIMRKQLNDINSRDLGITYYTSR